MFNASGIAGLAVVLRDGLCCRDFDEAGEYHRWSQANPHPTEALGTFQTGRGFGVLFHRGRPKRIAPRIQRTALRKLRYLDQAATLTDLRVPPGNRLEALKGDRAGQHAIHAHHVTLIDYH